MKSFTLAIMSNDNDLVKAFLKQARVDGIDPFLPDEHGRYPSNIAFLAGASPEVCDYIVAQEVKAVRRRERDKATVVPRLP